MQNKIIENLKKSGLRITNVRKEVLNILAKSRKPISVPEILSKIDVNKTTIYREIETLLDKGYLAEVDFADRTKRYELSNLGHHHHLICIKCRDIQDVILKENLLEEEKAIGEINKFKVLRHNLEFFGYCQNCI